MREIKFRGKDLSRVNVWVYGDLVCNCNTSPHIMTDYFTDYDMRLWPVDPATVGQFTGLLDANGKEIYEGDIVRFKEAYKGVLNEDRVRDVVGVVSYVYCAFKIASDGTPELWAPCLMKGVTVIGNVHDNPNLLEGENDRGDQIHPQRD